MRDKRERGGGITGVGKRGGGSIEIQTPLYDIYFQFSARTPSFFSFLFYIEQGSAKKKRKKKDKKRERKEI